jgi:hypothetical protein
MAYASFKAPLSLRYTKLEVEKVIPCVTERKTGIEANCETGHDVALTEIRTNQLTFMHNNIKSLAEMIVIHACIRVTTR